MQLLITTATLAIVSASAFGIVFAVAGGGAVLLLGLLSPEPEDQFLRGLLVWMFSLGAAAIAGLIGAVIGTLYALVPSRARDLWMAIALGAGVTVTANLLAPLPLDTLIVTLPLAMALSAVGAWATRKLGILK